MIHRALMGSLERFIGILLEHYTGSLPFWLSPVQFAIVNINEDQYEYCTYLLEKFKHNDIRAVFDSRNEKIGYKIRENAMQKIPYIVVVGNKEMDEDKISVRARGIKIWVL